MTALEFKAWISGSSVFLMSFCKTKEIPRTRLEKKVPARTILQNVCQITKILARNKAKSLNLI